MKVALCIGKQQGLDALKFFLAQPDVSLTRVFAVEEAEHERSREALEIVALCREAGVELSTERAETLLDGAEPPDLILAIKWRHMFSDRLLEYPKTGTFVIHDSLLPRYRGASPLNWAMIHGEERTGATLFRAVPEMDAGPIVSQQSFALEADDDYASANAKMAECYLALVAELHAQLRESRLDLTEQDESQATYGCRRSPEDGRIDWSQEAPRIHDLVRALTAPCPGAFTTHARTKLIVWKSRLVAAQDAYVGRIPGKAIRIDRDRGEVHILCGSGILALQDVQLGEHRTHASRLLRSISITLGLPVPP